MSYNTYVRITFRVPKTNPTAVNLADAKRTLVGNIAAFDMDFLSFDSENNKRDHYEFVCTHEGRWSEDTPNLHSIAACMKNTLIEVYAEGEENEDIWKKVIKNDKSAYSAAKIEFWHNDEQASKLKDVHLSNIDCGDDNRKNDYQEYLRLKEKFNGL